MKAFLIGIVAMAGILPSLGAATLDVKEVGVRYLQDNKQYQLIMSFRPNQFNGIYSNKEKIVVRFSSDKLTADQAKADGWRTRTPKGRMEWTMKENDSASFKENVGRDDACSEGEGS
ncbi:MAG: hypothetical protein COV44_01105 [Deltaproteobacteria bacterium CG11_big_fil_rev_8_21_14_0_20_45_16]|nr:MAG: hypothetical protein COV44_01105 [Deltaproteobacteria bacterium CG11_big_fil_rev_8_21_14_0_20_45_16]